MAPSAATMLKADDAPTRTEAARRGAELLRVGELVVFPTETVYGIGAAVTADESGLKRLREVKRRPADKPFTVHMPDAESASRYVDLAERPTLRRLLEKTTPGPITVVVEVRDEVIEDRLSALGFTKDQRHLLYMDGTIGLRVPADTAAAELLGTVEAPVVASSANRADAPPPSDAASAQRSIGDEAALVIDGGRTRYAKPSTVVRLNTDGTLRVLREGVYDERFLRKLMMRTILFVCSGNTCRSPMAEAITRHALASRVGVDEGKLEEANWRVHSAGVFAAEGAPATPEAWRAVQGLGVRPEAHRSKPLTAEMIRETDAVYCMTETHRQAAMEMAPDAAEKIDRLDPSQDIDDPIGADENVYVEVAQRLHRLIDQRLDALVGTRQ